MTQIEFNNKYKTYIEPGFRGCELHDEKMIEFLDKEFEELIKIKNFKLYQIKLKFGWGRFYANGVSDETITKIETTLTKMNAENV